MICARRCCEAELLKALSVFSASHPHVSSVPVWKVIRGDVTKVTDRSPKPPLCPRYNTEAKHVVFLRDPESF